MMLTLNIFFSFLILLTTEGQCTKLGEHDHHHHDHHHDQDHHQHHNSIGNKNTNDFVLNEDIFAKALAAEVSNGLFPPLPARTNDRNQLFTAPPSRGSTRFRMPSTLFTNPSTVTQRTTQANIPSNNTSTPRRTTPATRRATEKGIPQNLQDASNQEILTPIMSLASRVSNSAQRSGNSLRIANNVIKQNAQFPQTTTELNDPTGFAPRAPPKTAKQFDPFSSNKNAAKQQLAKFQIKPQNIAADTTGFAPRTPPPNAKKFNPVPSKKPRAHFRKTESASVAKEIKGFVPVSPPPTAPQFNPVPEAANTASFNFRTTVGFPNNELTTLAPTDFTDLAYDSDYDNTYDSTSDYDYDGLGIAGKALLDDQNQFSVTTDFSVLSTDDYPTDLNSNIGIPLPAANADTRAQDFNTQSQINVLGALSSTGNILNSPKYNSHNDDSHSVDVTHPPQRTTISQVENTATQRQASTAQQPSIGIRTNSNAASAANGPSAPTNQVANGRSSISDQLTQFTTGNNAAQSAARFQNTNLPVEGRENFEIGVPLPAIADSGASLQRLDNNQLSTNDFTSGRQLTFQGDLTGVDGVYPQYAQVPATSFRCEDQRYSGYFADPEAECQVFHICLNSRNMGSFLCPNGTLFHQQFFVCDWWYNVRCEDAASSYDLNSLIGAQDDPDAGGIFGSQLRDGVGATLRFDLDENDYDDDTDDDLTLLNYDTDEKK